MNHDILRKMIQEHLNEFFGLSYAEKLGKLNLSEEDVQNIDNLIYQIISIDRSANSSGEFESANLSRTKALILTIKNNIELISKILNSPYTADE